MNYSTVVDHDALLMTESTITATDEQEHGASLGVWIGLILIATASFWSQATVTEERFVPALNVISFAFQIPDDIAGATLMAAGASSPELFSSFVALFITHSSLGLGTVFGSEIFNQLIICAGAVYSSQTGQLQLNRAVVSREVFFYALGIVALFLALQNVGPLDENDHANNDVNGNEQTANDSTINHIFISFGQACLVFGGYIFYVGVCANMDAVVKFFSKLRGGDQDDSSASSKRTDSKSSAHYAYRLDGLAQMYQHKVEVTLAAAAAQKEVELDIPAAASTPSTNATSDCEAAEQDVHHVESIVAIPVGASTWGWIWFLWLFPLRLLIHWTIPDVRTFDKHGNPSASLATAYISCTMCLVWLVVGSCVMVASLEALAELLRIPAAVVGYTVSAVGTSLPNYVASVVAARNGFGNMAVSNALGSNTFNIMIGLGLPWVLYTSFVTDFGPYNELKDEGITEGVLIMAAILLLLVLLLLHSGFVLYIWHGHLFVVTYVAYLVYIIGSVYWK